MDPKDLIIVDYLSLLKPSAPLPTPNPFIDSKELNSDDPIIKLNQAWEREVKSRNNVFERLWELQQKWEKLRWINTIPVSSFHKV